MSKRLPPSLLRALVALLMTTVCMVPPPTRAQDADPAYEDAQSGGTQQVDPGAFEQTLAPYGDWLDTQQYGRVWTPAVARDPNWQPYTAGQWIYTDYGWYFAGEEDFGWIVYHYGRWLPDPTYGWIWIPDDVWGPAWVAWRQGDDFVGWSPMAPESVGYDVAQVPHSWIFVATSSFTRPDIRSYCFPRQEIRERFFRSRFHDRAGMAPGGVIGHDAGIDPRVIAGATGRPLRPYEVRPRIFPGTIGVVGGRRVTGRSEADPSRIRREIIRERNVPPAEPIYQERIAPGLDSPVDPGRPAVRRENTPNVFQGAPGATGAPSVRADPMTTPVPPPPTVRPVPQPPSEGVRPPETRIVPQAVQRMQPVPQPQNQQQQLPLLRPSAPQPAPPVVQAPAQVPQASPRLTPLNQQRPAVAPQRDDKPLR
jgi:hypothetical protein